MTDNYELTAILRSYSLQVHANTFHLDSNNKWKDNSNKETNLYYKILKSL